MFGSIFSLLLLLILISFVPETTTAAWIASPTTALLVGIAGYLFLLAFLYQQGRKSRSPKPRASLIAQGTLLGFLLLFFFGLGAGRGYGDLPLFTASQTLTSLVPLLLYLIGLWVFYYGYAQPPWHRLPKEPPRKAALRNTAFIAPFAIPFLCFLLLFDTLNALPFPLSDAAVSLSSLAMILLLFLFMPRIMIAFWQCTPLPDSPRRRQLEKVCQKCHFRHGGMKVWTAMNDILTAAIIGAIRPFRYILFTQSLLDEFPDEEVEAILIHEIGHSARRHLLLYPFIFAGMIVLAGIASLLLAETYYTMDAVLRQNYPSSIWDFLFPFLTFLSYALLFGLYFRLVFGSFSRLFERQADLHIFHTNTPPQAMIHALHHLGVATGNTHHHPSWHHGSLQTRIAFLQGAIADPSLVPKYHRHVRHSLILYFLSLTIGILLILAPAFPNLFPFATIATALEQISHSLAQTLAGAFL